MRGFLGFRPIEVADERRLCRWLETEVAPQDLEAAHLRIAVVDWCREQRLGPPTEARGERLIAAAIHSFEEGFFAKVSQSLGPETRARLDALVKCDSGDSDEGPENSRSTCARPKSDHGRAGLASVEVEVAKLTVIRDLALPDGLWAGISPRVLARYRARAATEAAGDLRRRTPAVRWTLLAAFCWQRRREITDGLVDLLIQVVHRIGLRAKQRVTARIEGVLRHCTDLEVQRNYVDSHGQSHVAFAFAYLLGFELMPRPRDIGAQMPPGGRSSYFGPPSGEILVEAHAAEVIRFLGSATLGSYPVLPRPSVREGL